MKKIAVVTMLIDHIGAAFFYVLTSGYDGTAVFAGADLIYDLLRIIGRTSFPIFCFLLVEGFLHTRSVRRYLLRLLLFALVSELPFDLAFYDCIWNIEMQNVFFTLLLGVLAMSVMRWTEERGEKKGRAWMLRWVIGLAGAFGCVLAAHVLRTDYGAAGVLLILVLYEFRKVRMLSCLAGYITMCVVAMESWCFPAFLFFVPAYNGEKGKSSKYFFYVFYPVHLLVLSGIRILCMK